jgi:methylmalonyl-CoA mutase cobalamin-binding domain/chain
MVYQSVCPSSSCPCLSGHQVPQLVEELRRQGMAHVLVVVGGVIPARDHAALHEAGVSAVFGPGTRIPAAALSMLTLLLDPKP